jgi:type I restriction enzyme S subunit
MANDELMKKFERVAGAYVDEIIKHHRQIRLLTEARDRLLPKLMSGEVAV